MLDVRATHRQEVWGVQVVLNARGTRIWPDQVKAMAVRKVADGAKASEVAREIGVTMSLMYKWLNAAKKKPLAPQFIQVLPPATEGKATAEPGQVSAPPACVVRLGQAEVTVPPGFPAAELVGILRAVKSAF